jgi:hypothetical protein
LSVKPYCLVPPRWSMVEYSLHTCDDRSHPHLSHSEIDALQNVGALDWLIGSYVGKSERERAKSRREKCVVKIRRFFSARGLSCSVGSELAEMLADASRRPIASAMLAHIKMRSEEQRAA